MSLKSKIKDHSDSLTIDTRLLLASGLVVAMLATFMSNRSDKAFTLLSTLSSTLTGGCLGILKERSKSVDDDEKVQALDYGQKMATPPIGSPETYEEEY